jgi:(p)ppGpp synthase/HD superfamily hydrolase
MRGLQVCPFVGSPENGMAGYSESYGAALALAARAHRALLRKGSHTPYIVHPVHVSVILLRHGFQRDVVIAGLLHDVVEDTDTSLWEIEREFGPPVAGIVAALTEEKRAGDVERAWEVRKREALDKLRGAGPGAAAVKAADVIHNARSLERQLRSQGEEAWGHYSRGPEETLWYYREVSTIVRPRLGDHTLVAELDAAIEDLAATLAAMGGI